jgi:DNA segregation ATPase FtsK/SpoIIIE-like protein
MFKKKNKDLSLSEKREENKDFILDNSESHTSSGKGFFTRIYGLIFMCIGIIGFLNSSYLYIGTFICYIFVYAFGIFSYFALGGIILLGLVLLIKGKWPRFGITFTGLGWIFVFLFGTLASSISIDGLTIPTFLDIHNANMLSISVSAFQISGINLIPAVYGGFFGDLFAALFITGTGMIGAKIFTYLFLIFGILLILRAPVFALYLWLKNLRVKRLANDAQKQAEKEQAKIKQLSETKEVPSKHINPFEETKYEEKEVTQTKVESPLRKDKNQEKDVFVAKPSNFSPMMTEYSHTGPNSFKTNDSEEAKIGEKKFEQNFDNVYTEKKIDNGTITPQKEDCFRETGNTNPSNRGIGDLDTKKQINIFENYEKHSEEKEKSNSKGFFNYFKGPEKSEKLSKSTDESSSLEKNDEDYYSLMNIKRRSNPTSVQRTVDIKHNYALPSLDLLSTYSETRKDDINEKNANDKIPIINNVFQKFNIGAQVVSYTIGPSVTRFNIQRDDGVKISIFSSNNIQKEISADLSGDMSVRIEEVVKGQSTSGVEIANEAPTMVSFKECLEQIIPQEDKLLIPFGENISSEVICASLDQLPHLLVSGTTGSGKSVFIHAIIMTLIMRNYPDELKFILIDPKQVEFTRYRDMPHLYCPIILTVNRAVATLKKLIAEMERRYAILSRCEVSKIEEYNELKRFNPEYENLPNLVCIIDEFADLMGQDPKNVDALTQRLTQKARAAGIYLIIATQRPSVKCITGTIKANIPARVALSLPSVVDSRTILDEGGAEVLIGKGDLLARIPSFKSTVRLQSAFVSNEEISAVVSYLRSQVEPVFNPSFLNIELDSESNSFANDRHLSGYDDELYEEVKHYVMESNIASTSDLQRRFSVGYGRAAAIFDALEDEGIIITLKPSNRKQVVKNLDSEE